MADTSAQAEIRGINIDKVARGFADEALVLRRYARNTTTNAREIRYYSKTAGFLDSSDTTAITASQIANTAPKALPVNVEQSWTRSTAYVRKYFVESPWISEEDIKDSDVDVLMGNLRDLVLAVQNQVEVRIYDVLADKVTSLPGDGGTMPTGAATADGWDDDATGDPVADFMTAVNSIRSYRYDTSDVIAYMHSDDHKNLVEWIINVKGSSIPEFASDKVQDGVVMRFCGVKIVVSNNATTDYVVFFKPNFSVTYKSFMPLKTAVVRDEGIGRKIRVWEEGEAISEHPNSIYVLTDTQV